jgi:hypothetical protein
VRCDGKVVVLSGLIKNGQFTGDIGKVSEACAPGNELIFNLNQHDSDLRVDMEKDGTIISRDHWGKHATRSWVSITGMAYVKNGEETFDLPLTGGNWGAYGRAHTVPTFSCFGYKEGDDDSTGDLVVVAGLLNGGSSRHLGKLPKGCRPPATRYFLTNNNNKDSTMATVDPNGDIKWVDNSGTTKGSSWFSLTGIIFQPYQPDEDDCTGARNRRKCERRELELQPGWTAVSEGETPKISYHDGGLMVLSGRVKDTPHDSWRGGGSETCVAQVPHLARPAKRLIFNQPNRWGQARVDLRTDGYICFYDATFGSWHGTSWVGLDGMHYYASGT